LKYKPSILAITLVFLGLQLQFELLQEQGKLNLTSKRELVSQLCQVYRLWRITVLDQMLKVMELPKVMLFCEHVMSRQL